MRKYSSKNIQPAFCSLLTGKNHVRAITMIAICVLPLFVAACDMFSTRDAEDPVSPRSDYRTATTPDILLGNLVSSMSDGIAENYMMCFVDSSYSARKFYFMPSAGSAITYPQLTDWNEQSENQYFVNLINALENGSGITLTFSNQLLNYYSDSASVSSDYTLLIPFKDQSKTRNYQGSLKFTLIRDQRLQWVISYWQDIKSGSNSSWSELKGRMY